MGTYLLDEPGIRGIVVNVRDVTERKRSEARLRLLESAADNAEDGILITEAWPFDEPGPDIVYVNEAFTRMTGYTSEEAVGKTPRILQGPDTDRSELDRIRAALPRWEPVAVEVVNYRKDGTKFWVEFNIVPVADDGGRITHWVSVQRETTERKEAEEALKESEERYRAVMEQSVEAIYLYDIETRRVLESNPAFQEMMGYTSEELRGMRIYDFIAHDEEHIDRKIRHTLEEKRHPIGELNYRREDGTMVVVEASASVISYRGKAAVCAVSRDVTGLRRAREALEESEQRHRRQARELDLLHQVRTALAQELELPAVFRAVVEAIARTYGYTQVSVYLLRDEELMLQHQVGYERVIERIPIASGIMGRVARTGEPVLLKDVRADPAFLGAIEGIVSEVCVPLFNEDRVAGTLNVESTDGVEFTEDDLRLMGALAEHVGMAISRAKLHTRVRESEERFRALIQNAPDVIMILGADSTILYDSPSIERVLGYGPEKRLGTRGFDYVHPDDLDRAHKTFAEVLEKPATGRPVEYRLRHKDGSYRHIEAVRTNLLGEPAVGGVVINCRDVTERREAEEALRESEERFRSLVQNTSDIITLMGADGKVRYVSPAIERVLGYLPEERVGKSAFDLVHPDDAERAKGLFARGMQNQGIVVSLEARMRHRDGTWRHVETTGTNLLEDPGVDAIVLNSRDVTQRKRAEEALKESEERFRSAFEDAPIGVTLVGLDNRYLRVNRAFCEMLGRPEGELVGATSFEITHPDDLEASRVYMERVLEADGEDHKYDLEKRYLHADGRPVWVLLSVSLVRDSWGEPSHYVCQHQDVSERKELEQRLEHQAFHDPLTQLPNRALFMDRLGQALARMNRRELPVTVLFLDLDNFKTVNDSLGHEAGDRLLVAVGYRLRECVRPEDTLARLGGDEFAVLVEGAQGLEGAKRVTRRILERLKAPFDIEGRKVFTSANVGIASAAAGHKDPAKLLRNADLAMYGSKKRGKGGYKVFEAGEDDAVLTRLKLGDDIRRALERGEFEIYYHPEFSLETGRIESLEALVRWEHPRRGLLEPGDFLPVAEEVGLILAIEERVLLKVCRQGRAWQDRRTGHPPLRICINASETLFSQTDLVERVAAVLRETGLEAQNLSLEIAERVLADGTDATVGKLEALKELGVHVVIENFGTAYSALAVLRRFSLNFLKLDRSLIAHIDEEENAAIVETTIKLAHALGWPVTVHGVETAGQLARLRKMGADLAQGYHFSKPVTAEVATTLLEKDLLRDDPGA